MMSGGKTAVRTTQWREPQRGSEKAVVNMNCLHRREPAKADVDRAVSSATFEGRAQTLERMVQKHHPGRGSKTKRAERPG
jgi:hypothetical protein